MSATTEALFISSHPVTGEVVGEHVVTTEAAVREVVARAGEAAIWWGAQDHRSRARRLVAWKRLLVHRVNELAALIRAETGKPLDDAILEVMLAVEHLDWAAGNAHKVLRQRRVPSGALSANQGAAVRYHPYGVVGVIGPWNYPLYTPMGSISYALAAGNAVVFKPSEYTPGVGRWLADRWAEAVPGHPVLQVVTGRGETGAALCRSGVDKLAFTGSAATAGRVMAACAASLTPVVIEAGGKDAMIVAADADLDAAVKAAAFGGFGNSGQTCAGVERVYVERAVYAEFVRRLSEVAGSVRAGASDDAQYGPMTMPGQLDIVRAHIDDAIARGGEALVGGPESVRPPFVAPVVLTGVPEDSLAVTEETFGPTLVVNPVADIEEAVRLANHSRFGLAASVFSGDRRRAVEIAGRLRAGAVSVNAVLGFAAIPSLPFGGVGDSGFGRIHGADGLREFSRAQSLTWQRFRAPIDLMTLDRKPSAMAMAMRLFRLRHGRGGH